MRKIFIFIGPPGAGKGTQAIAFSQKLGICHISTGDMLRSSMQAGTELGKQVKAKVDSGSLVSDDLMIMLIKDRIARSDCTSGFVLDGFPRTVPQAEAFKSLLSESDECIKAVVLFEIDQEVLLARLSGRRNAENRADDTEETQRKRLEVYNIQTAPLIDYYSQTDFLRRVDSNGSVEEVFNKLLEIN